MEHHTFDGSVRMQTRDDDICLFRANLMVAFFSKRPFAEMVEGVAYCVDQYLKMIPKDAFSWSLIGSTDEIKPLGTKDITRCQSMLTVVTAKRKDIHFRLGGHDTWGPDYSLMVAGLKLPSQRGFLDQTNGIECMFPVGFLSSYGEDAFVAMVMGMFEALQCDSGHAGIALVPGAPADFTEAGTHIAPRLMRSHGLDIGLTMFVVNKLGDRCRGARWLTMLSDKLIGELGGRDALAGKLMEGVTVIPGVHGLLMRAGHSPEIGDVERNQTTPLLSSVAHVIEDVTRFHNKGMLQFFNDPEEMYRWERRFWWQSTTPAP